MRPVISNGQKLATLPSGPSHLALHMPIWRGWPRQDFVDINTYINKMNKEGAYPLAANVPEK